jgi:hypothetical protein
MRELRMRPANPRLKELVVEASQALARLDGARIEELALSCQALNRDLATFGPDERRELARQAHEAATDMAVFARVLEATRSNLKVMQRLKDLRSGQLEYSVTSAPASMSGNETEGEHGND